MRQPVRGMGLPEEVLRFFDQKSLEPAFAWQDVTAQAHAYTFMVSKAVELELLTVFQTSIRTAIANGETFEDWREKLVPQLQRLGWYGRRRVDDPTGQWKSKIVDFSKPARLQIIFWANVRSAFAAGQWERIQRAKQSMPYLLYVRTTSVEPRIEHLAWAGTILPVDDPFWATHFPPNGWRCKCAVRQLTSSKKDDLLTRGGYSTDAPPIEERLWTNKRTGEITKVPVGIDPGWETNPGLSRAKTLVENVAARLEAAGEAAARERVREILHSPAPRILLNIDTQLNLPVAVSSDLQKTLSANSAVIWAGNGTITAKTDGKPDVPVDVNDFIDAQKYLDEGVVVDEGKGAQRSVFIEVGQRLLRIIVQVSKNGRMRISSIHPFSRGKLARILKERGMEGGAGGTSRST